MTLALFTMNAESVETKEFLKLKQEEAILDVRIRLAKKKTQLVSFSVLNEEGANIDNVNAI